MLCSNSRAGLFRLLLGLSLLCGSTLAQPVAAAPECPYEATVRTTEVEVRSGPGQRYYVTGRLAQNDRVTVVRHDPGGWYMIAPPAGSFSYIETALVRRTGDGSGIVELPAIDSPDAPRAIVRIGSEFSQDHSYYGRELSHGDSVQILGETTLTTERGPERMFKIAPPQLEYRWAKGDYLVAVGEESPAPAVTGLFGQPIEVGTPSTPPSPLAATPLPAPPRTEADPFAVPFRPGVAPSAATTTAVAPSAAAPLPAPRGRPMAAPAGAKEALSQLDLRYIEVFRQTPEHWDLDNLIGEYQSLRLHADTEMTEQIDDRLSALESRRQIWNDYQDFVKLSAETTQRDAELQAMQAGAIQPASFDPAAAEAGGVMTIPTTESPVEGPALPHLPQLPLSDAPTTDVTSPPGFGAGGVAPPVTSIPATAEPASIPPPRTNPGAIPQLDGAGIVQRVPSGRPGQFLHVLADPRGRVLAVLQAPPGLNLDSYVGRSLGVVGQRSHDARLRSDVIQVRQILPVQLTPNTR